MLHLLKTNTGKKTKFFPGKSSFNPLNLPSYQAGYLMNLTTDIPSGSIDAAIGTADWFDAKVLANTSKLLQRGNTTVTSLVNGFKCESINAANSRLRNPTVDILTNVFDFTFCFGFKRNGGDCFVLSLTNNVNNPYVFMSLLANTHIKFELNDLIDAAAVETVFNYADNAWHAVVCVVDQTNKTVILYTDKGEVLTAQNLLVNTALMTPNDLNDFSLGVYSIAPPLVPFFPGFYGDFLVFNSVLSPAICTTLLKWEKQRLGI